MGFGQTTTKGKRFAVEVLSGEEVRAMLAQTSRRGACGTRDRALIATLYRAGLRIREALDLRPKEVDLASGVVRVLNGKGGKQRVVAVDGETIALIEVWLAKREHLGLNGVHPLFCTLKGRRMTDVQVRQHLKALAVKAGIEKRVHPHGLRHSLAWAMVSQGKNLPTIQAALGHASLATTQTYLNHVRPEAVIEAMRDLTW